MIDHEMAFGFVFPIVGMRQDTPRVERLAFLRNHLYYPGLRGREDLDLEEFVEALNSLTDGALDQICDATPAEFGNEHLETIKVHVRRARDEGTAFADAVKGALR